MKLRATINVVETLGDSILDVNTFIIESEDKRQEIIDKAEKLFIEKAVEKGHDNDPHESFNLIEEGIFETYLNGNKSEHYIVRLSSGFLQS